MKKVKLLFYYYEKTAARVDFAKIQPPWGWGVDKVSHKLNFLSEIPISMLLEEISHVYAQDRGFKSRHASDKFYSLKPLKASDTYSKKIIPMVFGRGFQKS